jgi:hypothetical protein
MFVRVNGSTVGPLGTGGGGGDVTKVGTPVDNQVGVWTGDGTIEGSAALTFDGSTFSTTGAISATGTVTGSNLSGTNTGDEPAASDTVAGIVELATIAETNTGTDATRAVTPDSLNGWTGSTNFTTAGALTATSYGGIAEANLLDKTATETITGSYTFNGTTNTIQGTTTNIDPSGNINLSAQTQVTSGNNLVILDSTNSDNVTFQHDGTNLNTSFTTTASWDIDVAGLTGEVRIADGAATKFSVNKNNTRVEIRDGWGLQMSGPTDTGIVTFTHDDTDFNITATSTTDINMPATVRLVTAASTTTRAGLNIPEGTAPSAPVDGDVWVTAAGAFNARLNGVTVDLSAGVSNPLTADLDFDGNNLDDGGVIFLREQASADADVAGQGQIWVRSADSNLHFTNDSGEDFNISGNRYYIGTQLESATSSTTLANITGLSSIPLRATTYYHIRFVCYASSGTAGTNPGLRLRLDYTGSKTADEGRIVQYRDSGVVVSTRGLVSTTIIALECGTTTDEAYTVWEAHLETGTAGNLSVQFAQNTSNATASVISEGAFLEIWEAEN